MRKIAEVSKSNESKSSVFQALLMFYRDKLEKDICTRQCGLPFVWPTGPCWPKARADAMAKLYSVN